MIQRFIAVAMIFVFIFALGCATLPSGKTDKVDAVVSSYELVATMGFTAAKTCLATMEKNNYWTPEALPKAKAQYLMARANAIQAGDVVALWIESPKTAPLTMFPVLLNQGATVLGTILGGRFEMRKVDYFNRSGKLLKTVELNKRFILEAKATNKIRSMNYLKAPYGFAVTPEMIELAINTILVTANLVSNYVGEIQEISAEDKQQFIKRVRAAQQAIPLWE